MLQPSGRPLNLGVENGNYGYFSLFKNIAQMSVIVGVIGLSDSDSDKISEFVPALLAWR